MRALSRVPSAIHPSRQEMLGGGASGRRGYLTHSGRVEADKLCWLFQQLGAAEEATFQQREVSGLGSTQAAPRVCLQWGGAHTACR